jgi:hypothetical protein
MGQTFEIIGERFKGIHLAGFTNRSPQHECDIANICPNIVRDTSPV